MSSTSSTHGLNLILVNSLQNQQTTLGLLSEQVASGQQFDNLTNYDPTQAHNLVDFNNAVLQRQSYISSMQNVSTRLSTYDTSMTDIENMAGQAATLAGQNAAFDATKVNDINLQATNYLKQLTDDLNQQIGGRYVYAGTRYSTIPVVDLTTLTGAPTTTTTTSPALASYDTQFNNATSFTVNSAPTGTFTMGNTTIAWGGLEGASATSPVSIVVNGTPQTVAVAGLSTATTATAYASNLALTLNAIAASSNASAGGVPSTLTATPSAGTVTLDLGGAAPNAVTPDAGGATTDITWVGGSTPNGTVAQTPNSSVPAYTLDSALVDSNFSVTYGVSSNDPSFQKLVNGLRFISSACAAGTAGNAALYQTDMQQAATLINAGLTGIQTLHAQVANNQNTMTQQTATQNTDITTLKNQIADITQVNLTTVGAEINSLQTQLQASYSATATIEKLSLVSYL